LIYKSNLTVQKTKIRHPVMKFNLSPSGSEFNKIEFSEKETHPSSWDIVN